jgi:outer membrane protein assembly factor BamA
LRTTYKTCQHLTFITMTPSGRKYSFTIMLLLAFSGLFAQIPLPDSPASHLWTDTTKVLADIQQESSSGNIFTIGEIHITGNKKTKPYIIERELPFKRGDSVKLPELIKSFVHGRERLLNTRLFVDVVISLSGFRGFVADIQIDVKERWYIFPIPYVRPVDRNFTAWAEKNYSLSRVDYGLRYSHYNFTGRNDYLRIWLITGYSQQIELSYDHPYADKSLKHGFGFGFNYANLKEINVKTVHDQQKFINSDSIPYSSTYLRRTLSGSLRYYFRPALKTRHFFRLSFNKVIIDSAVTVYNPYYLNYNQRQVFYPEISYVVNYNNVDYPPYPLKGFLTEAGFLHRGINADMNLWQVYAKTTNAWKIAEKTNFVTQNMGMLRLPFDQPFYNQQLFVYGDFYMRGFEKYVVDGVAGALSRNTLLRELFSFNIPFISTSWSHDRIPVRIYAKTYFDCSYAYNKTFKDNALVNQMLYSGGFGVDVVTFYDLVFRFEYSFNQLGEKGFFFHIRNDF